MSAKRERDCLHELHDLIATMKSADPEAGRRIHVLLHEVEQIRHKDLNMASLLNAYKLFERKLVNHPDVNIDTEREKCLELVRYLLEARDTQH